MSEDLQCLQFWLETETGLFELASRRSLTATPDVDTVITL